MDLNLGFSTGALYATNIPINERIKQFKNFGCTAIELGYVKKDRLAKEPLENINYDLLKDFSWVSIHAPAGDFKYSRTSQVLEVLEHIQWLYDKFSLNAVVFHPDVFEDFSILDGFSFPVAMENMDDQKKSFQRADSLKPVLEHDPNWKLVLDLNHCYVNDRSLHLVQDLYSVFKNRIAQIHISGYQKLHEPLYVTGQREIIAAIPDPKLPIIIESSVNSFEEARKEYEFIRDCFQNV
jgi:hypothetical protein